MFITAVILPKPITLGKGLAFHVPGTTLSQGAANALAIVEILVRHIVICLSLGIIGVRDTARSRRHSSGRHE